MIRIAGTAVLGLALMSCPEEPDGYALVTGTVVLTDGSPYSGPGHVLCWRAPDPQPSFSKSFRVRGGEYSTVVEAPFGSRALPGEPFEFLCRVQASPDRTLIARRYATVPFSRDHSDFPTTRVDLRAGAIEEEP